MPIDPWSRQRWAATKEGFQRGRLLLPCLRIVGVNRLAGAGLAEQAEAPPFGRQEGRMREMVKKMLGALVRRTEGSWTRIVTNRIPLDWIRALDVAMMAALEISGGYWRRRRIHSSENETNFPVVVWALARK